jgi:hypothetical protein
MELVQPSLGDVVIDTDIAFVSLSRFDAFKHGYGHLIDPGHILALFSLAEASILIQMFYCGSSDLVLIKRC